MKKVLDHVGGEDVEETKGDFAYAGHHKFCVLFPKLFCRILKHFLLIVAGNHYTQSDTFHQQFSVFSCTTIWTFCIACSKVFSASARVFPLVIT